MNSGYAGYLLVIALIILFFGIILALVLKGRKRKFPTLPAPITCGNVSVFFDKASNVIIIPYIKDKYGAGRATYGLTTLKTPYTVRELGNALRTAMNSCEGASLCPNTELMNRLGFSSWRDFSDGRRNIAVHYRDGKGIIFNTTRRKTDGAYEFNLPGNDMALPVTAGDDILGQALADLLPRCSA